MKKKFFLLAMLGFLSAFINSCGGSTAQQPSSTLTITGSGGTDS